MAAPLRYAHNIPSLSTTIPGLPVLGNLDLNRQIVANTHIAHDNLINARSVAKNLEYTFHSSVNPGVTEEMVHIAQLRVRAIEGAHAAAIYTPQNTMEVLATLLQRLDDLATGQAAVTNRLDGLAAGQAAITNRLDGVENRLGALERRLDTLENGQTTMQTELRLVNSITLNHQIIGRNKKTQPVCQPLRKTVPGHDAERAIGLLPPPRTRARDYANPDEDAAIGSIPPNFEPNLSNYSTKDITRLMIFYNEDFGIEEDDNEAQRVIKFINFMTRH